ncbi:NUDIX hydrolase domain-like protein [Syncephalis fuscata]|nr:NUDIX hydrolase domain-like protein [Syncephalis fuscata]
MNNNNNCSTPASQSTVIAVDSDSAHLNLVNAVEVLHTNSWLELAKLTYKQPHSGATLPWEVVRRLPIGYVPNKTETAKLPTAWPGMTMDAVDIHAVLRGSNTPPLLLLVLQYRPPIDAYVLEFPSGLVDPGEIAANAALRELLEETGYRGRVTHIGQLIAYEPGLTNSGTRLVRVEVNLDAPENQSPKQQLDGDYEQGLEVIKLPLHNLLGHIEDLQKTRPNLTVDSRLYTYAVGQQYHVEQ